LRRIIAGLVALVWATSATIVYGEADSPAGVSFVVTGGITSRPIGHDEFCKTYADECRPNASLIEIVSLTDQLFGQLVSINESVNAAVTPVTDSAFYNLTELWTYPSGAGDCEDFVLAKRRALVEAGWPPSALLITVVRQKSGDGHAVLTVRTDRGDFVLDNLDPDVHLWNQTPYTFVKRQSQADAGAWVSITDDRTIELVASHH
jgi:predicted transglutaminase-like cysteine proteinase